ncbi:hypothetical protein SFRURICE_017268, partial [Spodoptera frugiperda]
EDDRVSHYIINRVVSADGTIRFRIGDQLFADMPALLAFYRLHYLDTTPLVRPLPQALAKVAAPPPPQPHQVLELVIAKFDFSGNEWSQVFPSAGLGFDSRVGHNVTGLFGIFENFLVVALSLALCTVYGNWVARYYMELITKMRLMVINRDEEQWWTARNSVGRTGSIPVPYVQRILDPSGVPYPPAEALNHLADPPSPPSNKHPQQRTNMQRTLPALARVKQPRVPNAYDKTALKLEEGDIIKVTKININGQWEGELHGKIGHFPFTCVEFLDENQAS